MPTIDQRRTWQAVEERLAAETDPVLRRNLETVLEHQYAEALGDVDRLMATLVDEPHYHNHGGPAAGEIKGRAAVRRFYELFVRSGCDHIEHPADRLVVDRGCIVTEGVMRIAFPGATLAKRGLAVADPGSYYLFEAPTLVIWPLDEAGLLTGEDAYFGADGFAGIEDRRLTIDDIVPLDRSALAPVGHTT
jgi:hypothetical protein